MAYDFSQKNPEIKDWLDTGLGVAPIRQFIYLHSHPLVKPNFVTEIEVLVYETGLHMKSKNMVGAAPKRMKTIAENLVKATEVFIVDKSDANALKVLHRLRELYSFCNKVKKTPH